MKCYFELFLGENTILSTEILNNSQVAESLAELGENMGEQGNFFGSIDEKSNVNSAMSASFHWTLKNLIHSDYASAKSKISNI